MAKKPKQRRNCGNPKCVDKACDLCFEIAANNSIKRMIKIKAMKEDKDTISNEYHELQYVADKFGVAVSDVMRAKEETQSSSREVIYERVQEIKDAKEE